MPFAGVLRRDRAPSLQPPPATPQPRDVPLLYFDLHPDLPKAAGALNDPREPGVAVVLERRPPCLPQVRRRVPSRIAGGRGSEFFESGHVLDEARQVGVADCRQAVGALGTVQEDEAVLA